MPSFRVSYAVGPLRISEGSWSALRVILRNSHAVKVLLDQSQSGIQLLVRNMGLSQSTSLEQLQESPMSKTREKNFASAYLNLWTFSTLSASEVDTGYWNVLSDQIAAYQMARDDPSKPPVQVVAFCVTVFNAKNPYPFEDGWVRCTPEGYTRP